MSASLFFLAPRVDNASGNLLERHRGAPRIVLGDAHPTPHRQTQIVGRTNVPPTYSVTVSAFVFGATAVYMRFCGGLY